jgi:SnoaL-like domain
MQQATDELIPMSRMVMRKTTWGAMLVAVSVSAWGDEGGAVPPSHAPPPPPLVAAAQGHEARRHIMNAPELLRAYLSKIQDPAAVAAPFGEDGVLELPQMNVHVQGRAEIEKFIAGLLKTVPDFRFKDTQIFIETPNQAFGEYSVEAVVLNHREGLQPDLLRSAGRREGKDQADTGVRHARGAARVQQGLIPRRSPPIGESACAWLR